MRADLNIFPHAYIVAMRERKRVSVFLLASTENGNGSKV